MKRKHNTMTEHYLVPAVLFLLNIALAHSIYAFASDNTTYSVTAKGMFIMALAFFTASLIIKNKILLAASTLFYAVVILCC